MVRCPTHLAGALLGFLSAGVECLTATCERAHSTGRGAPMARSPFHLAGAYSGFLSAGLSARLQPVSGTTQLQGKH